jgi:radical SAM family uncharacterized protein
MIFCVGLQSVVYFIQVFRDIARRPKLLKIPLPVLDRILPRVKRPGRYVGGELNAVYKDWNQVKVRMAFAFPDVYEVGMSHLGLRILYGLVNQREDWLMERVFAPWPDMEQELREHGLPLFSLESRRALVDFEVVGFTLQYEMSYTNLLNILDLGQIPLRSRHRTAEHPLVIAGGPGALNPEPLADFIDAFVLGEGEQVLLEILEIVERYRQGLSKESGPKYKDRLALLRELARVPGVYVPSLYEVAYREDGTIIRIGPREAGIPRQVQRRAIADLDQAYFPTAPIVPNIEVVHDRIMLEVFRGCQRGCRFCQAGMIYRPTRERSVSTLVQQTEELVRNTGYDEISLTSLSTGDYGEIQELVRRLLQKYQDQGVAVSLPSLRIDSFSVGLAKEVQKGRKTGLTFAPEAGTQRLRDVINKGVTEDDLFAAAGAAFEEGWSSLKLYFMIGLPTEEMTDLDGIVALARRVADLGTAAARRGRFKKRVQVTVSVSNFVPKAHTPFQWEGQHPIEELKAKQEYLRQRLRDKRISYNWHEAELSFWEAVIARGDRRLGPALEKAWQKGCRFDGWSEYFQPEKWREALAETGLNPEFYANRQIPLTDTLPWDHLSSGVTRDFLVDEYQAAKSGITTEDCRLAGCTTCGVCAALGVDLNLTSLERDGSGNVSVSDRI